MSQVLQQYNRACLALRRSRKNTAAIAASPNGHQIIPITPASGYSHHWLKNCKSSDFSAAV